MAMIGDHRKDCLNFLGDGARPVHEFLDQYAWMFPVDNFADYHRTFLHNSYGVRILTARHGKIGWYACLLHLTRDYIEGPIDHLTIGNMAKEFPRRLMWFNTMAHTYEPMPHVVRGWEGKSLVALATE